MAHTHHTYMAGGQAFALRELIWLRTGAGLLTKTPRAFRREQREAA